VYIRFNDDSLDLVATQYSCARFGDQCAGNLKQFVTDMKSIGTENIQAAKTAGQDVVDAGKKLAATFKSVSKQTQKYLAGKIKKPITQEEKDASISRQNQLLRSVYGSDFKRMQQ
jgi:spermidine synthase